MLRQPRHQLRQRHGAALSGDFTAVAEQDQAGNRADAKLRRQLCIGLAVELGQAAAALELTGSLRKGRGETAAGPAPAGPVINYLPLPGLGQALRLANSPAAALGLTSENVTQDQILDAMVQHPGLVQRPFVVSPKGTARLSHQIMDGRSTC